MEDSYSAMSPSSRKDSYSAIGTSIKIEESTAKKSGAPVSQVIDESIGNFESPEPRNKLASSIKIEEQVDAEDDYSDDFSQKSKATPQNNNKATLPDSL